MPVQLVFTNRRGEVIGDGPSSYGNDYEQGNQTTDGCKDDELPGVLLPEDENPPDKIPGVDMVKESVNITGVDNALDEDPVAEIDTGCWIR